jgi:hypothetical protein
MNSTHNIIDISSFSLYNILLNMFIDEQFSYYLYVLTLLLPFILFCAHIKNNLDYTKFTIILLGLLYYALPLIYLLYIGNYNILYKYYMYQISFLILLFSLFYFTMPSKHESIKEESNVPIYALVGAGALGLLYLCNSDNSEDKKNKS